MLFHHRLTRLALPLLAALAMGLAQPTAPTYANPPLAPRPVAEEGMWLPHLISANVDEMRRLGYQLTAEDIYNLNNASMKDAVVIFGGFCTGELISSQGLILTNHHCGYGAIQSLSTDEDNILRDGFWAQTRNEERPAEDLFIRILDRVEDWTENVNNHLAANAPAEGEMTEGERSELISAYADSMAALIEKDSTNPNMKVAFRDLYFGQQFVAFIYRQYDDVRLVGTPEESIGKFGGDTDNWMWPRHTGDFSMFRVYTAPDGKPAPYSEENVPYQPKHFFPVNANGVKDGDFTMIMGFPGSTDRYMTSDGIRLAFKVENPLRIKLRTMRLNNMKEEMDADPSVDLAYSSEYARVANYWKYFIGQNKGLQRLNTIEKKQADEAAFMDWVSADPSRKTQYGQALEGIANAYRDMEALSPTQIYFFEGAWGTQVLRFAGGFYRFNKLLEKVEDMKDVPPPLAEQLSQQLESLRERANEHFEDYHAPLDRKVFEALMQEVIDSMNPAHQPEYLKTTVAKKYDGSARELAEVIFGKSMFVDKDELMAFLDNPKSKRLQKDPAFKLASAMLELYFGKLMPASSQVQEQLDAHYRAYVQGLKAWQPDRAFYPDANFTLRVTYGTVKDYAPYDAVHYEARTTLDGLLEKYVPGDQEFDAPETLIRLARAKDYGNYAAPDGELPVCFIHTTDITGGNSGSPVLDGKGQLVGLAFDGNWEAMTGDLVFDKAYKRTISVDVRYILWVIDKVAGAPHLIEEMKLVRN